MPNHSLELTYLEKWYEWCCDEDSLVCFQLNCCSSLRIASVATSMGVAHTSSPSTKPLQNLQPQQIVMATSASPLLSPPPTMSAPILSQSQVFLLFRLSSRLRVPHSIAPNTVFICDHAKYDRRWWTFTDRHQAAFFIFHLFFPSRLLNFHYL